MTGGGRRTVGAESSRKVLKLLLSFSERRPTQSAEELARQVGVPLSTAYRYISLLREMGLIEEAEQNAYALTQRIVLLARAAQAANSLVAVARPVLDHLSAETGEASLLLKRIGRSAVCVALAEAVHPIRLSFEIGRPMPLHRGAAAKILLAAMPDGERTRYLEETASAERATAGRRTGLAREIDAIRRLWQAESAGEVDRGIWATAAAIRSGQEVIAALTVACLDQDVDAERRRDIARLVADAAAQINEQLVRAKA